MKSKNLCIEFIRGIACIFVVFIHCLFPGKFGIYMVSIARFAVPFFLIVTGYYSYKESNTETIYIAKQRFIKIIKLTIAATLFYFCINILCNLIQRKPALEWLTSFFAFPKNYFAFFCCNRAVFLSSVMWYLYALIYVYIVFIIINKFKLLRFSYILIPVLLAINIGISEFSGLDWYFAGNFLFTGIPFFLLGNYLHSINIAKKNLSTPFLISCALIGLLSVGIETQFHTLAFCYIGTVIMALFLFVFAIHNPNIRIPNFMIRFGEHYSMLIFIIHCGVINIVNLFIPLHENILIDWIRPIAIVLISFAFSYLYIIVKHQIKSRNIKSEFSTLQ